MRVGEVREIHRYPVKSMGGESLDSVEIDAGGVRGDRAWAVRDEVNGGIRGAKKLPALMRCKARYREAPRAGASTPAEIVLPDGQRFSTGDEDAAARVAAAIGHAVTLWPLLPADTLDHYRRGAPTHEDLEQELRAIFGRTEQEPLPDLGIFPPEILEFESPPGSYFDAFPLHLVSEQSLRSLQKAAPQSRFDVRRFRPNLLVAAASSEPFPELAWRGKKLRVGEAILAIAIECPRCVMTTHAFDDLPKDPQIMRTLVREAGGNLGVYATVETPGIVRAGDPVAIVA